MSAAVAEKPVMDSSLQKADGQGKGPAGGGVGNGAIGRLTTARYVLAFSGFWVQVQQSVHY